MEGTDFDGDDVEEEMYEFEVTGGGITKTNEVIFTVLTPLYRYLNFFKVY